MLLGRPNIYIYENDFFNRFVSAWNSFRSSVVILNVLTISAHFTNVFSSFYMSCVYVCCILINFKLIFVSYKLFFLPRDVHSH